MELAQRLTSAYEPQAARDPDPFWELKDRVHKAVIGGLGPRLFNTETDPATLRDRVRADVAGHLESESGLARGDRDRLVGSWRTTFSDTARWSRSYPTTPSRRSW